jgi:hypothetical protein
VPFAVPLGAREADRLFQFLLRHDFLTLGR